MRKVLLLLFAGLSFSHFGIAQKFKTANFEIGFYSEEVLENIEAHNKTSAGIIDTEANTFSFRIIMKDFRFEKELMEQHFNENYIESEKYPKATFKGDIAGYYSMAKIGEYKVTVMGELTIHGVTNEIVIPVIINVSKSEITISGKFKVKLSDYDIKIPIIFYQNIAEIIEIRIKSSLVPLKSK